MSWRREVIFQNFANAPKNETPITVERNKQCFTPKTYMIQIYKETTVDRCIIYSRTPLIRTLVIRKANYPDQLGPSGKFVENSTKLSRLEITGYWIKYSTVLWLIELQRANVAYFQRKIQLSVFSAYPDGSASQLIRINGVVLYDKTENWTNYNW